MKRIILLLILHCLYVFSKERLIERYEPVFENGKTSKFICVTQQGGNYFLEITDPGFETVKSSPIQVLGKETIGSIFINKNAICLRLNNKSNNGLRLITYDLKTLSTLGTITLDGKLWGSYIHLLPYYGGFIVVTLKKENKVETPYHIAYNNKLEVLWERFENYDFISDNLKPIPAATSYDWLTEKYLPMSYIRKPKGNAKDVHCGMSFIDCASGKLLAKQDYSAHDKHLLLDIFVPTVYATTDNGNFVALGYSGWGKRLGINLVKIDAKTGNTLLDKTIDPKSDEFSSKLPTDAKADVASKTMFTSFYNIKKAGNSFFVIGLLHNRPFTYMPNYTDKDLKEMTEYVFVAELDTNLNFKNINTYKTLPQFTTYQPLILHYNPDIADDKRFQVSYVEYKDSKNVNWVQLKFDGTKLSKTTKAVEFPKYEPDITIYEGKNGKMDIITSKKLTYSDNSVSYELQLEIR